MNNYLDAFIRRIPYLFFSIALGLILVYAVYGRIPWPHILLGIFAILLCFIVGSIIAVHRGLGKNWKNKKDYSGIYLIIGFGLSLFALLLIIMEKASSSDYIQLIIGGIFLGYGIIIRKRNKNR